MKSVERRFSIFQEKYPSYSSFVIFSLAIEGQNFTRSTIPKWFNKLVDKTDYAVADKQCLLNWLVNEINHSTSTNFEGKTTQGETFNSEAVVSVGQLKEGQNE